MVQQTGSVSGMIRKSTDGSTFTTLPAADNLGSDVEVMADGTMLAIGATGNVRVTQRSRNGGQTWSEVDSVPLAGMDSQGNLYSAASCDFEGWLVRKSDDGGTTWSDAERFFRLAAGNQARLAALAVDAADRVFVSGNSIDSATITRWIVRRLQGWDTTFTTVDDFELEAGMGGDTPIVSAGARHVHAAGMANTSTGPHWIVRRGDATGGTWTTLDDFTYPNATSVKPHSVYEGPSSTVIVVGTVKDSAGVDRVVTRRSANDGNAWTVTDEWTYSPGKSSSAGPIAGDRRGNVYGIVRGVASDDVSHWILRKLDCQSP
jgi:hypothetical protein